MEVDAVKIGGDAVVTIQMETSEIIKSASKVIACGTARLK
jgi:uncharacterized protein YbjQ (UPF0145 family)